VLYRHWRAIPAAIWHWPNFAPAEIACRGTGELLVVPDALDALQRLRDAVGPIQLNSAYRSALHNARVGGAPLSRHKFGQAFDISLRNHSKRDLLDAARTAGFTGFGLNYRAFLHVDIGPERTW
tara:strand:+ start:686 stop:1057 length:372 start_codon:yes stop_codon:yes gene_type:complete